METFREFLGEALGTKVIIGMIRHIAGNKYDIRYESMSKAPNWIEIPIGNENYDSFVKELKTKSFIDRLKIEQTGGLSKSIKITVSK